MSAWSLGPFANDDAGDFLNASEAAPSRGVAKALRTVTRMRPDEYIPVGVGNAGWAACELVALSFGRSGEAAIDEHVADLVQKLRAREDMRLLALDALQRIANGETSELAQLWHEGPDGAAFDRAVAQLVSRLKDAVAGARPLPRPKTGDVFVLPAEPRSEGSVVVQVVGPGEVAVFETICVDDDDARRRMEDAPARRVPASVSKLASHGRMIGNFPVRKNLKGKKYYAHESGALGEYYLTIASGGGYRTASYDEARNHDLHHLHGVDDLRAVAKASYPARRVSSFNEQEADLRMLRGAAWSDRRAATSPGPFGDVADVELFVEWIERTDLENVIRQFCSEADGTSGYGRPNEESERQAYAFIGLVALWRGWTGERWPAALADRLPARPNDDLAAMAESAARTLAERVITRDAELRLIWDGAPDGGAAFRAIVASLRAALA